MTGLSAPELLIALRPKRNRRKTVRSKHTVSPIRGHRHHHEGIWKTLHRFSWVSLVLLLLIGALAMFWPQYKRYMDYQKREQALEQTIHAKKVATLKLKNDRERFETDPDFVERMAHELGLAHPDETLYKFDSSVSGK